MLFRLPGRKFAGIRLKNIPRRSFRRDRLGVFLFRSVKFPYRSIIFPFRKNPENIYFYTTTGYGTPVLLIHVSIYLKTSEMNLYKCFFSSTLFPPRRIVGTPDSGPAVTGIPDIFETPLT